MATDLTTTRQLSTSTPAVDQPLLDAALRLLEPTDELGPEGKRWLRAEPHTGLRRKLVTRLTTINDMMVPAGAREIATAIKEMFVGFPSMRVAGDDAKVIVGKYTKDLEDLPLWAVQGACARVNRGSVEGASLDFAPSSARVRQVALEIATPLRAERTKISDVLQGVPVTKKLTAAEREYVRRGFEQLGKELKGAFAQTCAALAEQHAPDRPQARELEAGEVI